MDKKGQMWDNLVPWIIGIFVLIVIVGIYMVASGKGLGAIEYLKNLLRFG